MRNYVQRYLITMDGEEPFTTEWYDFQNNYRADLNMIVYDLHNNLYSTNGIDYKELENDHL